MEAIENVFNGTAGFGKRVTCQISRNGDLIHRVYLVAEFKSHANWVDKVGLALIDYVELEIGGQRIDKHYANWMYIWNELSLPVGKKDGYNQMVSASSTADDKVYVPLEFWFCRNVGLALPLIALQYHEVKINIQFAASSVVSTASSSVPDLASASLWVDYIYLDTDERRRFAQLSHEYLIEQLQFTGSESFTSTSSFRPKLNFNHPVKELVWVLQTQSGGSNWNNFVRSDDKSEMLTANIQLNGQDRFATRPSEYFQLVQPYQHHENIPVGSSADKVSGINVYSFALKPEEHQPSGSLNFSRIDTAYLNMTKGTTAGVAFIYAVNYNVLRIMSGMGGLSFSN